MATQSYEELIASATKIKNNELPESNTHDVVGDHLVQMATKAQEEYNQRVTGICEYNVSKQFPTGGIEGSNKYTLELALQKVPTELRQTVGLKCSFLGDSGELESWEYQGGTFTAAGSWLAVGGKKVAELEGTINTSTLPIYFAYTEQAGYLTSTGKYNDTENFKSKTSYLFSCKMGDVFLYKGRGIVNAVSALFRNGTTIVGSQVVDSLSDYAEISIPEGVNTVQFSSHARNGEEVILDIYIKNVSINGERIKDLSIGGNKIAKKAISGDLLADNTGLYIVGTYYGRYYSKTGEIITTYFPSISSAQGITQLLSLRPGAIFTMYNTWSDATIGQVIAFFDKDINYIGYKQYSQEEMPIKNGQECKIDDLIAIAPEGSKYFSLNSYKECCILRCSYSLIQPYDFLQKISADKTNSDIKASVSKIVESISTGEVLLNASSDVYNEIFNGNNFEELVFSEIDKAIGSNWSDPGTYKVWASDYILVSAGDKFNVKGIEASKNCNLIIFYNSNKEYVSRLISNDGAGTFGMVDIDFTIEDGIAYIRGQNYTVASSEVSSTDFSLTREPKYNLESKILEVLPSSSNVLQNAKWYCCGDSYSEGDYTNAPNPENTKFTDGIYVGKNKVYSRFISLRNNMDLQLLAKCGATCGAWKEDVEAGIVDAPTHTNTFYYNQLPKILENEDSSFEGYITLWFGINDSNRCNLGTIDDEDWTTFYGSYNKAILTLMTEFPLAKIGVIVTNHCNDSFKQAIRDVAQKWAIPYLDMEGDIKIPTISGNRDSSANQSIPVDSRVKTLRWDNTFRVASNNGHPNEKAHKYQSTFIENWLRSL